MLKMIEGTVGYSVSKRTIWRALQPAV